MARTLTLMVALLLVVGFSYAIAEPGSTYQRQESQKEEGTKPQTKAVIGTIVSIDMEAKKITIKDEVSGENDEYSFNDSTTFHEKDTTSSIDKVKTGDRVSLEIMSDDNLIVRLDNPSTVPLKD